MIFETDRCLITPFQKSDFIDVRQLYVNQEVREFLGGIRNDDSIEASLDGMLHPKASCYYWVVREKQTDSFIGLVSLDPHHKGVELELSYQFLPEWWGKDMQKKVLREIIAHALTDLHVEKVIAETQTANKASCKLLEKLSMKMELLSLGLARSKRFIRSLHLNYMEHLLVTEIPIVNYGGSTMELSTNRLIIRNFTDFDWKDVHEYTSNASVMYYLPEDVFSEVDAKRFVESDYNKNAEKFAIVLKHDHTLIGHIVFHHYFGEHTYEIGWVLHPDHQSKGYASEAAYSVLKYGFETLKLHRIIATCQPENVPSWKVMEKIGMRREGFFKKCIPHAGGWWDEYYYAILQGEWGN